MHAAANASQVNFLSAIARTACAAVKSAGSRIDLEASGYALSWHRNHQEGEEQHMQYHVWLVA
jgi:hypothetical protein